MLLPSSEADNTGHPWHWSALALIVTEVAAAGKLIVLDNTLSVVILTALAPEARLSLITLVPAGTLIDSASMLSTTGEAAKV